MKNKIFFLFWTFFLVSGFYVVAESFVLKRSEKRLPSLSSLQQECGATIAELIKKAGELARSVLDVQQEELEQLSSYAQSENNSFLEKCNRKELVEVRNKLGAMLDQIDSIHQTIKQHEAYLRKISPKNSSTV